MTTMYKYKSGCHALLLLLALAFLLCPDDLGCFRSAVTTPSPSVSVVTISSAAYYALDSSPPPTATIMAGRALLAVPLVMRLAAHMTGAGDMASATPMAASSLDVSIRSSPGCTINNVAPLDTTLNVTLGNRRYLLYFPVNYQPDKPSPLVLSYHGGTRTAEFQQALDLLTTTYFNQDFIVVYPNGIAVRAPISQISSPTNTTTQETWQGTPNVTTNDVAFTAAILDVLEGQYCIDTNRIFATGKSQGGGLVSQLACDPTLSRRVAAFAPVAGSFYQTDFGATCDPFRVPIACNSGRTNLPILEIHGLADDTIAYYGGDRRRACLPAIPYYCQFWADQDGLPLVNESSVVPEALGNSTAVRYEWGGGSRKGLVTHVMSGTVS